MAFQGLLNGGESEHFPSTATHQEPAYIAVQLTEAGITPLPDRAN